MAQTRRILLFGATGYTGELTARVLAAQGVRPVLVARNRERVSALAAEVGGLEVAVADATDRAQLERIVTAGDVLLSTVGPFTRFGEAAVRVAAEKGAHYIDSTGEGSFIREVFDRWGPVAAGNGATLLTAFGFDYVPGTLAGALAAHRAGEAATRVEVGYFLRNVRTSGGTNASVVQILFDKGYTYAGGQVRTTRTAGRRRSFDVDGRTLTGMSVPGSEQLGLPASYPWLRDVEVFIGLPASQIRALSAATLVSTRVGPLKRLLQAGALRVVKGSTGGPTAEQRDRGSSTVVAEASSPSGEVLASVRLAGPEPYNYTADMLAWGATALAEGRAQDVGALGPVGAFGLETLTEACAAAGLAEA